MKICQKISLSTQISCLGTGEITSEQVTSYLLDSVPQNMQHGVGPALLLSPGLQKSLLYPVIYGSILGFPLSASAQTLPCNKEVCEDSFLQCTVSTVNRA